MKFYLLGGLLAICAVLGGCASGPKLNSVQDTIPKLPDDRGRVYFYRTQVLGFAIQPSINLNGQKVGSCVPNGVSIADMAPGSYVATAATEVEHKVSFSLDKGEEKFIRCEISMGLFVGHANLELVDPATGRGEIQDLSFTGQQQTP
jgi:hypothetical protein